MLQRTTVPRAIESSTERTIRRSPEFIGALVAEGDNFLIVMAGVDMHQREGNLPGRNAFFSDTQHADRVFAAGEREEPGWNTGRLLRMMWIASAKPVEMRVCCFESLLLNPRGLLSVGIVSRPNIL